MSYIAIGKAFTFVSMLVDDDMLIQRAKYPLYIYRADAARAIDCPPSLNGMRALSATTNAGTYVFNVTVYRNLG